MVRFARLTVVAFGLGAASLVLIGIAPVRVESFGRPQASAGAQTAESSSPRKDAAGTPSSPHGELVQKYCAACHNEKVHAGRLVLEHLDLQRVEASADVWEKVVRKLRGGSMPPAGRPRPDVADVDRFVSFLETELDKSAAAQPNPGRPILHRLNRTEYGNAIKDLLAVEIDSRALLPPDDEDQGFDTIANALTVSPTLMSRYMKAARHISQLAVGDPGIRPVIERYPVPRLLNQDERTNDQSPFGARGGAVVRHYFPLDSEYSIRIRLRRGIYGYVRGLERPHHLDVRIDKQLVGRFTVGGEDHGTPPPAGWEGWPPYMGNVDWEKWATTADEPLQIRLNVKAGMHVVSAAFAASHAELEDVLQPPPADIAHQYDGERATNPSVEMVQIAGPYAAAPAPATATASRRLIFACYPEGGVRAEEDRCARQIVSTLVRRAYRRPASEPDLVALMKFFDLGREEGDFERGIQYAIERMLIDPQFVLRVERDPVVAAPGAAYRLTDLELASRLSFFLTSSIPDDELLRVAERGDLKKPAELERQVRRLLAGPRADALIDNFAAQWLLVRNISSKTIDEAVFPHFDDNLREAFEQETSLFLASQLREDRPVQDLLTANYTFLNDRLARHYGIAGVYGSHFRRVTLTDPRRMGLLGQGSVLAVSSYGNRTSPVLRGKWLLENVMGTPPPPPPPNVPALDEKNDGTPRSVRQRLEAHRRNPVCASCHAQLDPLGFGLENFDAIGGWRTTDGGAAVDASGRLPDGVVFDGPAKLREALGGERYRYQFARTLTEKLLTYALGRALEPYDMPAVRQILASSAAQDHRWSSVILGIVRSAPFQMRRSAS
jgi:mono/diheme cytochrome c family protein